MCGEAVKVLIPLLSKEENKAEFLEKATAGVKQLTLLTVIDTNSGKEKFGFTASQIGHCSNLAEDMRNKLKDNISDIDYITEWGDTLTKIEQIAQLKKIDKIVMKKQQNQFFDMLV